MSNKHNVDTAQQIWDQLGDVPVDEDECIDGVFLDFDKGTHREDIWHWVEETYDVSVAYLMGTTNNITGRKEDAVTEKDHISVRDVYMYLHGLEKCERILMGDSEDRANRTATLFAVKHTWPRYSRISGAFMDARQEEGE